MQDHEVRPGRLIEQPSSDGSGTERQAFGEFVSRRGELASYSFGWTTGSEEPVGRLTIGIGAGNPGGGSFHIVVFAHEVSYGMSLVDEPFADVPEGGPDLSREDALAHEDLDFVWFVADLVMDRDVRARWMRHWILGTNAIVTPEVLTKEEPVLFVQHDEDDHLWQLIGSTGAGVEGSVLHLWHLIDEDPTIVPVLDLTAGEWAWRDDVGTSWRRGRESS